MIDQVIEDRNFDEKEGISQKVPKKIMLDENLRFDDYAN